MFIKRPFPKINWKSIWKMSVSFLKRDDQDMIATFSGRIFRWKMRNENTNLFVQDLTENGRIFQEKHFKRCTFTWTLSENVPFIQYG